MQQPSRAQEYEGYWGNVSLREGGGAGGESPQALMSEMKSWRWDGDPRGPWRQRPAEQTARKSTPSHGHQHPHSSCPPCTNKPVPETQPESTPYPHPNIVCLLTQCFLIWE